MTVLIRTIRVDDAAQLLNLRLQLDQETQFMLFEPGERKMSIDQQRKQLASLLRSEHSTIFVAEHQRKLVGFLEAIGSPLKRKRHTLYIVIGILRDFTGQGIGTRLFEEMEKWARDRKLHRLELTVMAHNQAGIALYTKCGFTVEGRRRDACFVNGQYVDELYMAKLL
ncbi:MAG: GNAT family N-acetyltransferase [Ktedonobacteraceae bacterium]|nr:GNAT family N-acetyltransferase [Ktedonobacteraceae bacterium]